ncbi:hypothetical protein [Amycolatopsis jiangsuensis]|uniref:Uncharacterized protein n=1 Tax=Amycolatopsis jiangsuensis TaxID=1181879 RepID=A0A840IMD0_9PSEU|nr:hypothetical protein [Amycolatopsis jiangsuensis]MBB4682625.1 hypothetical protein [Amycolatopsis jiangsuensis]
MWSVATVPAAGEVLGASCGETTAVVAYAQRPGLSEVVGLRFPAGPSGRLPANTTAEVVMSVWIGDDGTEVLIDGDTGEVVVEDDEEQGMARER